MAWYADPANGGPRREKMRAYSAAMTELGHRYPEQRLAAYQANRQQGKASHAAHQLALAAVRDSHKGEFAAALASLRGGQ